MEKYIINHEVSGIKTKKINDLDLVTGRDNICILVLDETANDNLAVYYNKVLEILLSPNRLILVSIEGSNNIEKAICTLMSSYRVYDMYKVVSKEVVDVDYCEDIQSRKPTFDEIQTFIGGDITAYSDINTILIGIENLVREGNLDGLQLFLEQHLSTISNFTEVVDYMRTIVDSSNRGELQDNVNKIKGLLENTKKELEQTLLQFNKAKEENSKIKGELVDTSKNFEIAKAELEELQGQIGSGTPIIRTYSTINTAPIKCKAKIVVYFKEISKVQYVNSLVTYFVEFLKMKKFRVKLLIYDNKCGLNSIYNPLSIIGGSEYASNKDRFVGKLEKFVVVEPNPTILVDILTYIENPYDIVIVYDRMGQVNDLVDGNNVHKLFVVNSSKDLANAESYFKITDNSTLITKTESNIHKKREGSNTIDIPYIADFSSSTDTAKNSKYIQLKTKKQAKPIMTTLMELTRINTIKK